MNKTVLFIGEGTPWHGLLMRREYVDEMPGTTFGDFRWLRLVSPKDFWTYTYFLGPGNVARYVGRSNDHDVLFGEAQRGADALVVERFLDSMKGTE